MFYYSSSNDFVISNVPVNISFSEGMVRHFHNVHLFGYFVGLGGYNRNESLSESSFESLVSHNVDFSGIYVAVKFNQGRVELVMDPLCQFNVFYFSDGINFIVSSSIKAMSDYLKLKDVNSNFLYDQMAYQSPMRGETILSNVFYIQFDDISYKQESREEFLKIDASEFFTIHRPNYRLYDELSYDGLLDLYVERLNSRAKLISLEFDKVHVQLTGGADSRLSVSSFVSFDNVECYVYGNGENQNRLIFEEILRARDISPVSEVRFVGQPLNSIPRILKGLNDSNFLKLNNLNTYMNGPLSNDDNYCKITGYYGANISGGVALPPYNTDLNSRLKKIPVGCFTYHDYVKSFTQRHGGLRPAAFNDMFYINNRAKSHYAAHSIADNKNISSIDVLYDFINLLLVEKCPYSDFEIDRNAITIDLIYKNDKQLALFPYDKRKIPRYREFDNIPLINCFDGFDFQNKNLDDFDVVRPVVNCDGFDSLCEEKSFMKVKDMFEVDKLKGLTSEYKELLHVVEQGDIQTDMFLYFILAKLYLQS